MTLMEQTYEAYYQAQKEGWKRDVETQDAYQARLATLYKAYEEAKQLTIGERVALEQPLVGGLSPQEAASRLFHRPGVEKLTQAERIAYMAEFGVEFPKDDVTTRSAYYSGGARYDPAAVERQRLAQLSAAKRELEPTLSAQTKEAYKAWYEARTFEEKQARYRVWKAAQDREASLREMGHIGEVTALSAGMGQVIAEEKEKVRRAELLAAGGLPKIIERRAAGIAARKPGIPSWSGLAAEQKRKYTEQAAKEMDMEVVWEEVSEPEYISPLTEKTATEMWIEKAAKAGMPIKEQEQYLKLAGYEVVLEPISPADDQKEAQLRSLYEKSKEGDWTVSVGAGHYAHADNLTFEQFAYFYPRQFMTPQSIMEEERELEKSGKGMSLDEYKAYLVKEGITPYEEAEVKKYREREEKPVEMPITQKIFANVGIITETFAKGFAEAITGETIRERAAREGIIPVSQVPAHPFVKGRTETVGRVLGSGFGLAYMSTGTAMLAEAELRDIEQVGVQVARGFPIVVSKVEEAITKYPLETAVDIGIWFGLGATIFPKGVKAGKGDFIPFRGGKTRGPRITIFEKTLPPSTTRPVSGEKWVGEPRVGAEYIKASPIEEPIIIFYKKPPKPGPKEAGIARESLHEFMLDTTVKESRFPSFVPPTRFISYAPTSRFKVGKPKIIRLEKTPFEAKLPPPTTRKPSGAKAITKDISKELSVKWKREEAALLKAPQVKAKDGMILILKQKQKFAPQIQKAKLEARQIPKSLSEVLVGVTAMTLTGLRPTQKYETVLALKSAQTQIPIQISGLTMLQTPKQIQKQILIQTQISKQIFGQIQMRALKQIPMQAPIQASIQASMQAPIQSLKQIQIQEILKPPRLIAIPKRKRGKQPTKKERDVSTYWRKWKNPVAQPEEVLIFRQPKIGGKRARKKKK